MYIHFQMTRDGDTIMTLTRESMVLIAICITDLVATIILINGKVATEGNPIMAFYLNYGIGTFVMMKITLMFLPIFVFEYSRQYRPRLVRIMMRTTIAAYLCIYLLLFLTINVGITDSGKNVSGSITTSQTSKLP